VSTRTYVPLRFPARARMGRARGLGALGNLDPATIAQYAANAGFSGPALQTAVAIALAESGGNPNAVGDLNLGTSVGLWQINLRAHPEFANVNLRDPQTNANAAFAIYTAAGSSFSPWSTYKSGAYQAFLSAAPSPLVPPSMQNAPAQQSAAAAPLTIDASTGLPIEEDSSAPQTIDASTLNLSSLPDPVLYGGMALAAILALGWLRRS
jgi:hypothetical protein